MSQQSLTINFTLLGENDLGGKHYVVTGGFEANELLTNIPGLKPGDFRMRRDTSIPQFIIPMQALKRMPFNERSLVLAVGRDVESADGEVSAIVALDAEKVRTIKSGWAPFEQLRGAVFDDNQLSELSAELPDVLDLVKPWKDPAPKSAPAPVSEPLPASVVEPECAQTVVIAAKNPLPDGWTVDDVRFLLEKLTTEGPILLSSSQLGIPTIHDLHMYGEEKHEGFGYFAVEGAGFTISFEAGGAMRRTPSGNGWTRPQLKGDYLDIWKYDLEAVRRQLESFLASPPIVSIDVSAHAAEVAPAGARVIEAEAPEAESDKAAPASDSDVCEAPKAECAEVVVKHHEKTPAPPPVIIEPEEQKPAEITRADHDQFQRMELELITGMLKKSFRRALNQVERPGVLRLALQHIPQYDAERRALVERRLNSIAG